MTSPSSSQKPIHLVILIHGLFGSPANVATVAEELHHVHSSGGGGSIPEISHGGPEEEGDGMEEEREANGGRRYREASEPLLESVGGQAEGSKGRDRKDELVVYSCNSFGWGHTWDGVDINAQRAAKELLVDEEIRRLEEDEGRRVGSISIMGYSLGGLIARYLIGVLYSRSPSFFEKHTPAAFVTIATPHLGTLRYGSTTNKIVHTIGKRLFSRSGRQLYCNDKDEEGRCLLEVMADTDGIFIHALQSFNRVLIVANGCHDLTVPYPTASISLSDPFQDYAAGAAPLRLEIDDRNVVMSYRQIAEGTGGEREGERTSELVEREEEMGDVKVTVTVTRTKVVKEEAARLPARPSFPPFFYLKPPFTYGLFVILPFLIPLWLCLVICFTTYQSFKSAKRHRLLSSTGETQPLLSAPIPSTRPKHRAVSSLRSTPDQDSSGTATPPFEILSPSTSQIPLYLTAKQERMVRNLNSALPHMERIVAWFPFAFNSHATLIMRDYRKFPAQEAARGVIREVARRILDAA